MEVVSEVKMFGGKVIRCKHNSAVTKTPMVMSVFLPPMGENAGKVKVVYYLSGLTCDDQNFTTKSGAQRVAAELGVALVAPDTSPRNLEGDKLPDEDKDWDFGSGAGFYVNATQEPWSRNYKMFDYVTKELPEFVCANFPILDGPENRSITGHSMGGHGALICFLKNPGFYKAVSAFAPISNPINCPWGEKAFSGYLGSDNKEAWKEWDATELAKGYKGPKAKLLVSQGLADGFYEKKQLLPENLQAAVAGNAEHLEIDLRMDPEYDHSYYYIASMIESHLRHLAA